MTDRIPTIKYVMKAFPFWIAAGATLREAEGMMSDHDIRHLPVMEAGTLVGVVSDRDLSRARSTIGAAAAHEDTEVREVMQREAYVVDLNERLDNVLLVLAERHIGSALVVKDGRLAGIFTTMDACRAFAEHLRSGFGREGDEVA